MLLNVVDKEEKYLMVKLLPIQHMDLGKGVKYLGLNLKPNSYKFED